jgi:hypothetical protein
MWHELLKYEIKMKTKNVLEISAKVAKVLAELYKDPSVESKLF